MVAELSVAQASTAMMLHGGRSQAMASGHAEAMAGAEPASVVVYPGLEALERTPAEDLKKWLLSQLVRDNRPYVATLSGAPAPSTRPRLA